MKRINIDDMLREKHCLKICAPMVRYSKLGFRALVRRYGCELAYTPMIIANSFVRSEKCQDSEFTTNSLDNPLIVQFAANNAEDMASATELIYPHANGVDLNCGCPQRWATQEQYGAYLINHPDLVCDMVRQSRNRIPDTDFSFSIKIRVHNDIRKTVELCRRAEHAGVHFISVHGRTKEQRHEPVSLDAIRTIKQSLGIPVVANGDVQSLADVERVHDATGVDGVMAARGILNNPAMYAGHACVPQQCIQDWLDVAVSLGVYYRIFHHHFIDMFDRITTKADKRVFNLLTSTDQVLDYLGARYGITYRGVPTWLHEPGAPLEYGISSLSDADGLAAADADFCCTPNLARASPQLKPTIKNEYDIYGEAQLGLDWLSL